MLLQLPWRRVPGRTENQFYRKFTPRYLWKLPAERRMRLWARLYQPQFRRDCRRICFSPKCRDYMTLEKGYVSILRGERGLGLVSFQPADLVTVIYLGQGQSVREIKEPETAQPKGKSKRKA
jgi:hypothetical protein